jgi:hypothetical protein
LKYNHPIKKSPYIPGSASSGYNLTGVTTIGVGQWKMLAIALFGIRNYPLRTSDKIVAGRRRDQK